MGLANINFGAGVSMLPAAEGAGAAGAGEASNPLLFLQQLLGQLQKLTGGQGDAVPADLQAALNGDSAGESPDGKSAVDALKAMLASLKGGQEAAEGGKSLPGDQAEDGSVLPDGLAALLSQLGIGDGAAAAAKPSGEALTASGDLHPLPPLLAAEHGLPTPLEAQMMAQMQASASPPPTSFVEPPPGLAFASGLPVESRPKGADAAPLLGAVPQGLIHPGIVPSHAPQPVALMEALNSSKNLGERPVPLAAEVAGLPGKAEDLPEGRPSLPALGEGFLNSLAAAAEGNGINLPLARGAAPPPPSAVATPFGQPGWQQEFGDRIVWMAGKSMDSASIHLNPPNLGPVEVRITMNHEQQASIQFVSEHAAVREAIEAAVPRLREMLGGQQVSLTDVNVAGNSSQQQSAQRDESRQQFSQQPALNTSRPNADAEDAMMVESPRVVHISNGVLSLYA